MLSPAGGAIQPQLQFQLQPVQAQQPAPQAIPPPPASVSRAKLKSWVSKWQGRRTLPGSPNLQRESQQQGQGQGQGRERESQTSVYCLDCTHLGDVLLPSSLEQAVNSLNRQTIRVAVKAHVSLYDASNRAFFGRKAPGAPNRFDMTSQGIMQAINGTNRFTVQLDQSFLFHSDVIDPASFLCIELSLQIQDDIVNQNQSQGQQQQQQAADQNNQSPTPSPTSAGHGIGWGLLPFVDATPDVNAGDGTQSQKRWKMASKSFNIGEGKLTNVNADQAHKKDVDLYGESPSILIGPHKSKNYRPIENNGKYILAHFDPLDSLLKKQDAPADLARKGTLSVRLRKLGSSYTQVCQAIRTCTPPNFCFAMGDDDLPAGMILDASAAAASSSSSADGATARLNSIRGLPLQSMSADRFEVRLPDANWVTDMRYTLLYKQECMAHPKTLNPAHPGDKPLNILSLRLDVGIHNGSAWLKNLSSSQGGLGATNAAIGATAAPQPQIHQHENLNLARVPLQRHANDACLWGGTAAFSLPCMLHDDVVVVVEMIASVEFAALHKRHSSPSPRHSSERHPVEDVRLCWALLIPDAFTKAEFDRGTLNQPSDLFHVEQQLLFGPGVSVTGHKVTKPLVLRSGKEVKAPVLSFNVRSQNFLNWLRETEAGGGGIACGAGC